VIRLDAVSKQHGCQTLVLDASISVFRGDRAGLVGPTGSGKSTVFRMIVGEEAPDSGQVAVDHGVGAGYFTHGLGDMGGRSVIEETIAAGWEVSDAAREMRELEHAMAIPKSRYVGNAGPEAPGAS
jgi:ATPase subunit of ABC transporter with duplicated ATPase domains